jgi:hypothetical protein
MKTQSKANSLKYEFQTEMLLLRYCVSLASGAG